MQAIIVAGNQEDKDFLSFVLRHAGLAVATTAEIQRVTASLPERPVDLILVATKASPSFAREIEALRAATPASLMVVVDTPTEDLYCSLLDAGVDLVLERPLSPRILSRYVRTLLRRNRTAPSFALPTLELDEIVLDPATRTVTVAGQEPRRLTQLEFRLLYVLMTNRGQTVPTDAIVEHVWGYSGEGNRGLVRGLIRRLRRKIEPDKGKSRFIHNVPGVGYRFSLD